MKIQKNQEKVWDAIAEQWYHFRQQQFKDVKEEIEKLIKLKKGKILEIGCGNCRNLKDFAKAGFVCYGIDFSRKMLKFARLYCKKYGFKVILKKAKVESLPFKNNTFDYLLAIAILHHLKPRQQIKAVKEMYRVLKDDGLALISVWNKKSKLKEEFVPWKIKNKIYLRYYYFFSLEELKKLFYEEGFKILKEKVNKNIVIIVKKIKKEKA